MVFPDLRETPAVIPIDSTSCVASDPGDVEHLGPPSPVRLFEITSFKQHTRARQNPLERLRLRFCAWFFISQGGCFYYPIPAFQGRRWLSVCIRSPLIATRLQYFNRTYIFCQAIFDSFSFLRILKVAELRLTKLSELIPSAR